MSRGGRGDPASPFSASFIATRSSSLNWEGIREAPWNSLPLRPLALKTVAKISSNSAAARASPQTYHRAMLLWSRSCGSQPEYGPKHPDQTTCLSSHWPRSRDPH
jgi:hypothetical protein